MCGGITGLADARGGPGGACALPGGEDPAMRTGCNAPTARATEGEPALARVGLFGPRDRATATEAAGIETEDNVGGAAGSIDVDATRSMAWCRRSSAVATATRLEHPVSDTAVESCRRCGTEADALKCRCGAADFAGATHSCGPAHEGTALSCGDGAACCCKETRAASTAAESASLETCGMVRRGTALSNGLVASPPAGAGHEWAAGLQSCTVGVGTGTVMLNRRSPRA
mmetsp:Transcript_165033/g.529848  ORF Transcript_165033/g.529848 Transcript_165033/m.529848 type:complete len:229 (+) Transcript_165033:163-849(+)